MTASRVTNASLHHAILRNFVDHGHAPSKGELAAYFGVQPAVIAHALEALAADHGVVLHPHSGEIWVVHPFSTTPTNFVVRQNGRLWWGNCAWCSLGIAGLLGGSGVVIDTTLGAEGEPVRIHVDNHRVPENLLVHFPVPMKHAWDNVLFTCSVMLLFSSEAYVADWSKRHAMPRGDVQHVQKIYDFARVWYGRHLDPDWQKWTTEQARSMFERFDLRGPIWELPPASGRF